MRQEPAKTERFGDGCFTAVLQVDSGVGLPPPITRLCAANSPVIDGFRLALTFLIGGVVPAFAERPVAVFTSPVASASPGFANSAESPARTTLVHFLAPDSRVLSIAQTRESSNHETFPTVLGFANSFHRGHRVAMSYSLR